MIEASQSVADQPRFIPSWARCAIVLVCLLGAAICLQWNSGAYRSEFGSHPDEAAHYVTGLMVRDYLTSGFPRNPMRFAEEYYEHYPKVALGHYPPVLYIFEGTWSLIFSGSRPSILIFLAVQSFLLAAIVFFALEKRLGFTPAVIGAELCIFLPLEQQYASMVMADLMLAIFCLLAGLAFAQYLATGRALHSGLFGLYASLAILTKGSALFLGGVPLVALILSGRLTYLKRWSLWIAAPIVVILCGPWMALTYRISGDGFTGDSVPVFFRKALPYFSAGWVHTMGWAIILPAAAGALTNRLFRIRGNDSLAPFTAVMTAIPLCLTAFICVTPVGLELRYLLPAVPCVVILAIIGISAAGAMAARNGGLRGRLTEVALLAACFLGFFAETFRIPVKRFSGFRSVAEELRRSQPNGPCEIIISSDARGEGAFVAELAMQGRKPAWTAERASKLLAKSDWMGRGYNLRFENEAALAAFLEESSITWIVVDQSIPADLRAAHNTLLEKTLLTTPGRFRLEKTYPVQRGGEAEDSEIRLYHKAAKS